MYTALFLKFFMKNNSKNKMYANISFSNSSHMLKATNLNYYKNLKTYASVCSFVTSQDSLLNLKSVRELQESSYLWTSHAINTG